MAVVSTRTGALAGALAGAAAGIYVGATALGGLLDPGYSHVSMHVSELTSSHAPDRALLAAVYIGYNVALGGLGFALLRSVARSRWLLVASWSLVLTAVVGVLLVTWFPQDSYGQPATTAGAVHIVLAGVAALLSILTMVAAGCAFRADRAWARLGRISMLAAGVMVVTGVVGAIGTAATSPYMGLLQRLPIGTFLLWLAVVAWFDLRRLPRTPPSTAGPDGTPLVRAARG